MIVIADSGSSKTDWLIIDKQNQVTNIETPGINPVFQNEEEIFNRLQNVFDTQIKTDVENVYFYGAGCIKDKTSPTIKQSLKNIFTNASVFVEDDMLGAARALFGKQEGIACILGTGSNSCYYNGKTIIDKVPALGFILGDEGSGAYMGKIFLNNYFKRAIPTDLKQKIDKELYLDMAQAITAVYKAEYPSRYLASFSKFFKNNIEHPYIKNLVKQGLTDFIAKNIEHYDNYQNIPVSFVGSIAYYYQNILEQVAKERNIQIGQILQRPIDSLMKFHLNN